MTAECYIITINTNIESVLAAKRCISTGDKFGLHIDVFDAYTPIHNPLKILKNKGVATKGFQEYEVDRWSHGDAAAGCFLSHFTLWEKCIESNIPILIFEHDAIITDRIPSYILDGTGFDQVVNLGIPGHDEFKIPEFTGVGLLFSSCPRFKGTHAYAIKPIGAKALIDQAKKNTTAVDLFLNSNTFPFLEELYPWPVSVEPRFTTIQRGINPGGSGPPPATGECGPFARLDEFGVTRE